MNTQAYITLITDLGWGKKVIYWKANKMDEFIAKYDNGTEETITIETSVADVGKRANASSKKDANLAKKEKFFYFLTTHSNVLIDQFSKQKDAQITHITQEDGWANTVTVQTYLQKGDIFDDLDVRASDLLQATPNLFFFS